MAETLDIPAQGESIKRPLSSENDVIDANGEETPSKRPKLDDSNAIPNHVQHEEENVKSISSNEINGAIDKYLEHPAGNGSPNISTEDNKSPCKANPDEERSEPESISKDEVKTKTENADEIQTNGNAERTCDIEPMDTNESKDNTKSESLPEEQSESKNLSDTKSELTNRLGKLEESLHKDSESSKVISSSQKKESFSVGSQSNEPYTPKDQEASQSRKSLAPVKITAGLDLSSRSSTPNVQDNSSQGEDDDEDLEEDGEGRFRTRSQTRKAQGIQDEKPKSIYVELSEDSDYTDDSAPSSPWIDPISKLSPDLLDYRVKATKTLSTVLRNQESKLLLLKKLRLNQQQPPVVQGTNAQTHNLTQHAKVTLPQNANNSSLQQQRRFVPGSNQNRPSVPNQQHPIQRPQMPQLMRGVQNVPGRVAQGGHSGPPPLMMASQGNKGQVNRAHNQQSQLIRQHQNMKSGTNQNIQPGQRHQVNNQNIAHNQNSRVVPGVNSMNEAQSAVSRQAAAKLALRKQLEKTLLQIPPPKPPPPELHFLPSAANNEFIILVGLEEVVNTILSLSDQKKDKPSPEFIKPFKCSQCKTDFTTIWKQDSKQGIMCEACIVTNQKRALKAEHTNRLKTAFVKALQQEQEIEQRMQQSQANKQSHSVHSQQAPTQQAMYNMTTQSLSSMRRVLNPIPSQRLPSYPYLPQMAVPSSQIQMLAKQQFYHSNADRQRQREYLLDMIPSSGLSKQWKH